MPLPPPWPLPAQGRNQRRGRDANDRIRIGFIGVGGRAQTHLDSAIRLQRDDKQVEVVAVCDVFNRYRDETVDKIEHGLGTAPTATGDYRDIINDPSIDAVVISTPDHWHATQTIDAPEGRQGRLLRKADDPHGRRGARRARRLGSRGG